jgi:hypothetical protein
MASNNYIYKMSNAGGMSTVTRYVDMLAGNTTWNPWEPAGAYDALATVTVPSGGAASVEFAGIPAGYKHLQLRVLGKASTSSFGNLRFNGDTTTSNYRFHSLYGTGSGSALATTAANAAYFPADMNVQFGADVLDILDYSNTSKNKTTRALGGWDNNGSGNVALTSNLWMSTAAISTITITAGAGTFSEFSQFALYGVK